MITIQIQGLEELLGDIFSRSIFLRGNNPPATIIQTTEEPEVAAEVQETEKPRRGRGRPKKEEASKEEVTTAEPTEELSDLSDLSSSEAKPATPPEKPKSGKITKEEAVRIGAGVMRSHGPAALKSILQTLGIERASALSDEQIPQFIEMCEMLE